MRLLILICACVPLPLPLPSSPDISWCKTYHIDSVEDRRALCVELPPFDGGT
jgi:hypothetical protein